jgi:hypothetical protein
MCAFRHELHNVKRLTCNACPAGDEFSGTAWDILFQGMQTGPVLEAAGTDVMAVGNHEFDYGALLCNAIHRSPSKADVLQSQEP